LKKDAVGSSLVVIAGALWGTMGIFVKKLTGAGLSSIQVPFLRLLVGSIALVIMVALCDRKLLKIRFRDLPLFLLTGLIGISGTALTYYTTIAYAGMSVAAVLMYVAPVFVIILSSLFFKEKATARKIIACVIAVCGCALMSGILSLNKIKPLYFIIGIISAVCYATYSIGSKMLINRGYKSLTIVTYSFIIATIPVAFIVDYPSMVTVFTTQPVMILHTVCLSVVACAFPYILYTGGLEKIAASKASILSAVEPVVAAILGFVCLKEAVDISKICGLLFVLLSIVILNTHFSVSFGHHGHHSGHHKV